MSGEPTSDTALASKPLITLLNAPAVETDDDKPSASQCCGGGSCSI
ncbi:hypothetical protein LPW41_11355 [Microbacterium sp. JC 701]|uniref:FxLD family lantipeptide n=1 Tax=Microbacterium algihabitans TaxID=3075992 RepID=A0ABU3RWH8_9MICO|nr:MULTISPECIES: hypothetical protein [unclassified Microbacterium]MCD2170292.1 hypothetical protein [Microbacterium sp. JC 701]MDU0326945.1 hypothetical protein [Microbacterium sp. KSW2-21]